MGALRQLVTGPRGEIDEQAIISLLGFLAGCFYQGYSVIALKQPFDAGGFGMFIGALVGGSCAGLGVRSILSAPVPPGGGYDNPG